jgi:hypothetical protein
MSFQGEVTLDWHLFSTFSFVVLLSSSLTEEATDHDNTV